MGTASDVRWLPRCRRIAPCGGGRSLAMIHVAMSVLTERDGRLLWSMHALCADFEFGDHFVVPVVVCVPHTCTTVLVLYT